MSFTQNWYSRPIPPDIQFKERVFQPQISVSINKLYKWNIDGLFEQKIMRHMSDVGIAYQNNHDLDQSDIINLLVIGTPRWWDSYPASLPIFAKNIGCSILDDLNTLIYTILKHFVGTPSNISPRVSDLLNILRGSTMTNFRWYQDVFISRVMLRKDCQKPYLKERFIAGLPPIFAHKVKQILMGKNDSINYDNLTYDDIFSAIKKKITSMCNNEKLLTYRLQIRKKAKYKMSNFCEQYGLCPIAPSRQRRKTHKSHKSYSHKEYKRYKKNFVKPNDFHVKKKNVSEKYKQLFKFNKFNILKIDNKDQKELFKILESNNSFDSLKDDFSSSNNIKSVKTLTKSKENGKKKKSTISFEETLEKL